MISVVEKKWQGNFKPPQWALGHFFQQVVIKQWHNRKIMSSQISISGKKKGNIIFYLQKVFMTNVLQCKVLYFFSNWNISSVQLLSCVWLFATPWTAARRASLSITNFQSLLKLMFIESVVHPTFSSSVVPFSSHIQSFPASGSFPMSQFFTSSGQSIGASASASVLPMNILEWFALGWTGWNSLQTKGLSRVFQHHSSKASILRRSAFFMVLLSQPYMTTGKTIALTRWTFVSKVMSMLFSMLSRLVTAFLPRSKCLLISWLQSPSAVILEPKKTKSVTISIVSPSICYEVMGPDATTLVFWKLTLKTAFALSSFTFFKRLFSSS